jgi:hypothetical protein
MQSALSFASTKEAVVLPETVWAKAMMTRP